MKFLPEECLRPKNIFFDFEDDPYYDQDPDYDLDHTDSHETKTCGVSRGKDRQSIKFSKIILVEIPLYYF